MREVTGCEYRVPGAPREVERTYVAPFARANREVDYRIAWAFSDQSEYSS